MKVYRAVSVNLPAARGRAVLADNIGVFTHKHIHARNKNLFEVIHSNISNVYHQYS